MQQQIDQIRKDLNEKCVPSYELTEEQLSELGRQLYEQMIQDDRFRGPAGPPGGPGSIDEARIREIVKESLPSITIDVVRPDGKIARQTEDLSEGDAKFTFKFRDGEVRVK